MTVDLNSTINSEVKEENNSRETKEEVNSYDKNYFTPVFGGFVWGLTTFGLKLLKLNPYLDFVSFLVLYNVHLEVLKRFFVKPKKDERETNGYLLRFGGTGLVFYGSLLFSPLMHQVFQK